MRVLGDLAQGRDNNLNLIRMLAALAVLVSHAYPIALGPGAIEPLERLAGASLGTIAVAIFFVISGYLIAESFTRAKSLGDFIAARILRLWPALIVSLTVVAFAMGPLVTTLSILDYLFSFETWGFLFKNSLLAFPQYTLPGVFETLPYPAVEGSIWTLFYEVVFYLGIFAFGLFGVLSRRSLMTALIVCLMAAWVFVEIEDPKLHLKVSHLLNLGLPFAVGTLMWLWKGCLPLSLALVWGMWGLTFIVQDTVFFGLVLIMALAYSTMWLSFVPSGWLRHYNRVGDYSYGVYIYAFPAQGLAVWIAGPMLPFENMLLSLPICLIPSIISWHFLEKPALTRRRRVAAILETIGSPARS